MLSPDDDHADEPVAEINVQARATACTSRPTVMGPLSRSGARVPTSGLAVAACIPFATTRTA
jgi:hypothetical protein